MFNSTPQPVWAAVDGATSAPAPASSEAGAGAGGATGAAGMADLNARANAIFMNSMKMNLDHVEATVVAKNANSRSKQINS